MVRPKGFPKFGKKWHSRPVVTAEQFTEGFAAKPKTLQKAIFVFSQHVIDALEKEFELTKTTHPYGDYVPAYVDGERRIIVLRLGIGAPVTVTTTEELACWGIREFLLLGYAGSLTTEVGIDSLVLCTKAIRDEGTSHHYIPSSLYAYPDSRLTLCLAEALKARDVPFVRGPTWTTDAPYRETAAEVQRFRKLGVITVEMEASALFAVARVKGVRAAAAFTVSDILSKRWSGFHRPVAGPRKLARLGEIFRNAQVDM